MHGVPFINLSIKDKQLARSLKLARTATPVKFICNVTLIILSYYASLIQRRMHQYILLRVRPRAIISLITRHGCARLRTRVHGD